MPPTTPSLDRGLCTVMTAATALSEGPLARAGTTSVTLNPKPNGANKNAVLRKCPHHSASQHSPRQKSDTGFEAQILAGFESHILKAERRLHTLDVVSQPSRTFGSPRARRDAPNKRRSLLKRRVPIHDRHPRGVTRQTSDGDFEARVFNATRWLWTSDEVSQPSRTFEPPRACRVAQDKRALVARRKRLGNKPKK